MILACIVQKLADEDWVQYLKENNSKIVELFQVQLTSHQHCENDKCNKVSYQMYTICDKDMYSAAEQESKFFDFQFMSKLKHIITVIVDSIFLNNKYLLNFMEWEDFPCAFN